MKPRLVFINHHCCCRVVKQAMPLFELGYSVSLICGNIVGGRGAFTNKIYYEDPESLREALKLFNDKDIFTVHNEPSWMVSMVREVHPKARIIFDVHDSNYFRAEGDYCWYEEDSASELCDAYVFVCETAKKYFPRDKKKPAIVIPSANPGGTFVYGPFDHWGGLVSQGGHVVPNTARQVEAWRDYTQLYLLLKGRKQVFAYCAEFTKGSELDDYYISLGCKLGQFSHGGLIQAMGRHDWSLTSNITGALVWKRTMPNKFYDSMAAGLPVVNFECTEADKLIKKYDVGITVKDIDEFIERWDEHKSKRVNVIKHRREFAAQELFTPKLIKLYAQL